VRLIELTAKTSFFTAKSEGREKILMAAKKNSEIPEKFFRFLNFFLKNLRGLRLFAVKVLCSGDINILEKYHKY
jgi:hypothetical protein